MARRRRKRKSKRKVAIAALIVVAAVGYLLIRSGNADRQTAQDRAVGNHLGVRLTGVGGRDSEVDKPTAQPKPDPGRRNRSSRSTEIEQPQQNQPQQASVLLALAEKSESNGDRVGARTQYNRALELGLPAPSDEAARNHLARIADQTIFGPKRAADDPLVAGYVIQAGDTMGRIAKKYHVTADVLARINGFEDKNKIRAGQSLKVIRGPFHVEIFKARHALYVYLQDTFVRQYVVGLGSEGNTPTGEWSISNKLINPTYFSPRGEGIIAADDPNNPLGNRWIGLEGVNGEASGQQRYGIHGTIDPASIGRDESLGCIRLHNEDVEILYELLVEGQSRVVIFN